MEQKYSQNEPDYSVMRASKNIEDARSDMKKRIEMEKHKTIKGDNKYSAKDDGNLKRKDVKSLDAKNAPKVDGYNKSTPKMGADSESSIDELQEKDLKASNAPKVTGDNKYGVKDDGEFKEGSEKLTGDKTPTRKAAEKPPVGKDGNPEISKKAILEKNVRRLRQSGY
jgi:secreted protein with Ig-like and vWFA domain